MKYGSLVKENREPKFTLQIGITIFWIEINFNLAVIL